MNNLAHLPTQTSSQKWVNMCILEHFQIKLMKLYQKHMEYDQGAELSLIGQVIFTTEWMNLSRNQMTSIPMKEMTFVRSRPRIHRQGTVANIDEFWSPKHKPWMAICLQLKSLANYYTIYMQKWKIERQWKGMN